MNKLSPGICSSFVRIDIMTPHFVSVFTEISFAFFLPISFDETLSTFKLKRAESWARIRLGGSF